MGVERLPGQFDPGTANDGKRPSAFLTDVDLLSEQRVAVKGCLNPDLILLAGDEPNLKERGDLPISFQNPVVADRRLRLSSGAGLGRSAAGRMAVLFAAVSLWQGSCHRLLLSLFPVPDKQVLPSSAGLLGTPIDESEVDAFGLAVFELCLEGDQSGGLLGKDDHSRGVPIDSVNDERRLAVGRAQVSGDLLLEVWFVRLGGQRDGQQPGRLVDHDQARVLVQKMEPGVVSFEISFGRTAGAIVPDANPLSADDTARDIGGRLLDVINEDATTFDRQQRFRS